MVDASIGGNVAINAKVGKNLIGAFHMPTNIYISESFLKTLPDTEMVPVLSLAGTFGAVVRSFFLF